MNKIAIKKRGCTVLFGLIMSLIVLTTGCNIIPTKEKKETITLSKTEIVMTVDDISQVTATTENGSKVKFKSNDESVVLVTNEGKVYALAVGTTTIVASADNAEDVSCKVTVNPKVVTNVFALSLNKTNTLRLEKDFSFEIVARATLDGQPVDAEYTYTSSKEGVATVDANGVITAVANGQATITVKANYQDFEETKTIEVNVESLAYIQLGEKKVTLTVNEQHELYADFYYANALTSGVEFVYISMDSSIATVDANGVITAVGAGETRIYVSLKTPYYAQNPKTEIIVKVEE